MKPSGMPPLRGNVRAAISRYYRMQDIRGMHWRWYSIDTIIGALSCSNKSMRRNVHIHSDSMELSGKNSGISKFILDTGFITTTVLSIDNTI